jgi:hypothetical protein
MPQLRRDLEEIRNIPAIKAMFAKPPQVTGVTVLWGQVDIETITSEMHTKRIK